jgi:hypothetical protein
MEPLYISGGMQISAATTEICIKISEKTKNRVIYHKIQPYYPWVYT